MNEVVSTVIEKTVIGRTYPLDPRRLLVSLRTFPLSFHLASLYLVFEYVRPQSIYPSIDFIPWAALFAVGAVVSSFARSTRYNLRGDPVGRVLLGFGFVVLVSTVFSKYPAKSIADLDTFFTWLVIYFAIVRSVCAREQFYLFLLIYLACNLKMTQHGFLSWVGRGFSFDSWGVVGGPGWFHNSGEFGIQLCIFAPLGFFFARALWVNTNTIGRAFLVVMPLTAVFSIVASSSRGAIFGLGTSLVWLVRHVRHALFVALVLGAVGSTIFLVMPDEFKSRFESMGDDKTSLHRLDRWDKAWETIKERPIFGVGHSAWVPYYADRLSYGPPGSPLVHNMFLQCATELGLVGLAVFLLLLFRMFRVLRTVRVQAVKADDAFAQHIAAGLEAGLIGLIVSSMFITVLYYPYVWIHAAFVTAFAQSFRAGNP